MTPLPKRRLSTARQGQRRRAINIRLKSLQTCSNCREPVYSHTVCAHCGYYNGKQVKIIKRKNTTIDHR